jgi:uncharacterized membrane protein YbhN (UPF0104 family)
MKKNPFSWLGPSLVLLIFCGAVWLLYTQLTARDLQHVAHRLHSIVTTKPSRIFLAIGLTVINYMILVGYDLLAVRYVGEKLPLRRVALASFTAYTCGYNFGSTLAGTSVRYRLYSAWGVPTFKILQLLVILALTFWFGMFFLAGVVFLVAPLDMPAALHLPFANTRPLGGIFLAIALIYVGLSALHNGQVRLALTVRGRKWFDWMLPVPPFKLTVYQILIASADLLMVAAVLYSLWPGSEPIGYLRVLGVYMLVFVTGVLTHVPGGYGVMEAVLVSIIPDMGHRSDVIASWLLFRAVYYLIPLAFSAVILGWYELRLSRRRAAVVASVAEASEDNAPAPQDGNAARSECRVDAVD